MIGVCSVLGIEWWVRCTQFTFMKLTELTYGEDRKLNKVNYTVTREACDSSAPSCGNGDLMESFMPYPLCICTVLVANRGENEDDVFI